MASEKAFPVIPVGEYRERWDKVARLMDARNLDLLIAYGDDRAVFGPAHIRWLTNFPVHFEPVLLLMARGREPILICGPESPGYIEQASVVKDARVLKEFTHPDEDYPFSRIQSFSEIVAEAAGGAAGIARIGLAGGGLISWGTMTALRNAVPKVEWIDMEDDMCRLRSIKTPAEIAVIRHAYMIAQEAITAGFDAIAPGVTEREVNAAVDAALWKHGGEGPGIATTITSGPGTASILGRSTMRPIRNNELVVLTVAPRYEGYHAAIGRAVFLGDPGAEARRAHDAARKAAETCRSLLRPGAVGSEVEGVGRKIMAEAGLGDYFPYSGIHSVGVVEFEPPIFGPSAKGVFEKDMCISIDIPVFNTPWGGLRFEDGYLITESGAEQLHTTDMLIQK